MRYSTESKYRKYVKGYGFLPFRRKFGDKCNKIRNRCCKIASKRVIQKTAEAKGDLIENKIADKITSLGKTKSNEKEDETNKRQEIYIPPKNRMQIIDDLRLF